MRRKTTRYKNKGNPDCEYYEKGGYCSYYEFVKCSVHKTKCCGYDDEECPVAIEYYDPYLAGDIEEW